METVSHVAWKRYLTLHGNDGLPDSLINKYCISITYPLTVDIPLTLKMLISFDGQRMLLEFLWKNVKHT